MPAAVSTSPRAWRTAASSRSSSTTTSAGAPQGQLDAAARQPAEAGELEGSRPQADRRGRPHPRGHPRPPRCGGQARRHHRRPHRHPLRARARPRREGQPGHRPRPRHPVRDGVARRAHPRPHPRSQRDRCGGAQQGAGDRHPRRRARRARGGEVPHRARRRPRPRHRRQVGAARRHHAAARAHRRFHRLRQVELHQLDRHVAADALHARPGAPHPRRPEAGGARRLQRPAAPPHRGRHQPEEGRQRARLGRARDGHALRAPRAGRRARHHRATTRCSTVASCRRATSPIPSPAAATSACRSS